MDRVTADAQRDHSWQPQPCLAVKHLVKFLVDVFLWHLFPDGLQGHQSSQASAGDFTFPAWCPICSPGRYKSGEFQ